MIWKIYDFEWLKAGDENETVIVLRFSMYQKVQCKNRKGTKDDTIWFLGNGFIVEKYMWKLYAMKISPSSIFMMRCEDLGMKDYFGVNY